MSEPFDAEVWAENEIGKCMRATQFSRTDAVTYVQCHIKLGSEKYFFRSQEERQKYLDILESKRES